MTTTRSTSFGAAPARDRTILNTINRMAGDGRLEPLFKGPGIRGAYVFSEAEIARAERERKVSAA